MVIYLTISWAWFIYSNYISALQFARSYSKVLEVLISPMSGQIITDNVPSIFKITHVIVGWSVYKLKSLYKFFTLIWCVKPFETNSGTILNNDIGKLLSLLFEPFTGFENKEFNLITFSPVANKVLGSGNLEFIALFTY